MQRMLIVDDEQDICECLRQFFTSRGFSVASVFSGEEALERLAQESPDLILLDIKLPGLSGIEVLRRMRSTHPHVRVIMVSALDEHELREQAKHYGASAYITKPFDLSDLTWSAVFSNPST
ncbi:MAG: response regulator [Candidatus Omnitrophica bacterium]|nr:response regulator [Candidatus Omnitrophota bacterium]